MKTKNFYYRITNALRICWWAFKNPQAIQEHNFKMVSGLLEMIFIVGREGRPYMSNIAMVHTDAEKKTHPCIVPFEQLPEFQQKKDALFCAIVDVLK